MRRSMCSSRKLLFASLFALGLFQGTGKAEAAQTVTITVGFAPGGLYDMTSRSLARVIGEYLPDHPTVIVQNKPGAGGLVAANYIARVAPKDGSALAVIGGGNVIEPLFGNQKAQFDPRKLTWLGTIDTAVNLCAIWHKVPVKSIDDAMKREVVAGSTGRGSRTTTYPTALNTILGTKFKILSGYRGGQEITSAMEKGEVDSYCGVSYSALVTRSADWLRDRKLNFIIQFGYEKDKLFPDVPLVLDLIKNQRERDAMGIILIDTLIAWPMVAPGDLPKDKADALRRAYMATMKDKAFLSDMARIKFNVNPVPGEKLEAEIGKLFNAPKDVIDYAKKLSGL